MAQCPFCLSQQRLTAATHDVYCPWRATMLMVQEDWQDWKYDVFDDEMLEALIWEEIDQRGWAHAARWGWARVRVGTVGWAAVR